MLDVESLQCFIEAARLSSFRKAARAVALSPAAFGQRIRTLEDQLGVPLFQRTTRRVSLTPAGIDLLPHAENAVAAVERCQQAARGDLGPAPVAFTIGTRHELGMSWVVPMVPKLEQQIAGLTLHIHVGSGPDLINRVRAAELDCAVSSSRLTDPELDFIRLHEERYVFVGHPELLARTPLRRACDAAEHTLIDTNESLALFRYWRDAPGGLDSLEFGRVLRMGTIEAIRHCVRKKVGVAVLPEYYVARDLARNRLSRILPRVRPRSDHFRLVFRADDPRRSLLQGLGEAMRERPLR